MRYDFTTIMDRRGHDALAVDALGQPGFPGAPRKGFDPIPMWVADMNFPVLPAITDAIIARAQHPAFGYFRPTDAYFDAIISWQRSQNGVEHLEPRHIGYANGVLAGVVAALGVLCSRGDKVLIHAPTYIGFTHSLEDNGYNIVHSPLVVDENGIWRMDFEDMERKILEHNIHATVFCSPHNPCGRVWERWEIEKAMALFEKHNVYVISDEIWSDLTLADYRHIPTQSVSQDARQRTVALYAPSKTFNLAGLVDSYSIVYNDWLRSRMEKEISMSHSNAMNVLSMHALMGAYGNEGRQWLTELRQVLTENAEFACDFIEKHFEGITVSRPQGTYMLFVDCSGWCKKHGDSIDAILRRAWDVGVAFQDGRPFHGPCHLRMNLALPTARIREAFERMKKYVFV